MSTSDAKNLPASAFAGRGLLKSGPLIDVALAVKRADDSSGNGPVLVFDDATGRVIDLDLRGTEDEIRIRMSGSSHDTPAPSASTEPRGRGRPKLGVNAREVTLLPQHWEWLAAQPGGASVTLRKLVHEARRTTRSKNEIRAAQNAAYRVMSALAGDLPNYEEAVRALFAQDRPRFERQMQTWPADIRDYAVRLAFGSQMNISSAEP